MEGIRMQPSLVTIGMPIYNGGQTLRRSLDSLLAQTYPHFEVVISDNASTDGVTAEILAEYAQRDSRIRVTRQPENLGALGNFLWVLEQARGDYFMWAAHDDAWSPNYVAALCQRLVATPTATLAAGVTKIERRVGQTESIRVDTVPEPPAGDRWTVLDRFLAHSACVWIYGLYRTALLRQRIAPLIPLKTRTADRSWLTNLLLNAEVVGTPEATFYYTSISTKGAANTGRKPRTRHDLTEEITSVGQTILGLPSLSDRWRAGRRLALAFFPIRISPRNPFGAALRWVNVTAVGLWLMLDGLGRWTRVLARR
jgi:glycosyltransferase involved in cell wall biosynthesis